MIRPPQSALLRTVAALLVSVMISAGTTSGEAEPIYSVYSTALPSQALGGLAPYQNITPEEVKDSTGHLASATLPLQGVKFASLVWWYADHVKSKLTDWPKGDSARAKVVLRSPEEAVVDIAAILETSKGEAAGVPKANVELPADREVTLYLPLPTDPAGEIGKIRLSFTSAHPLPRLDIKELSVGSLSSAVLHPPDSTVWRTSNPVPVSGRAEGEAGQKATIKALDGNKSTVAEWSAPLKADGAFEFDVDRRNLPAGQDLIFTVAAPGKPGATGSYPFFSFPVLDPSKKLGRVERHSRDLTLEGKPYAFLGVNYTPFLLGLSRNASYELVARNFREMHEWGITAIRLNLPMAMIQPAPGVFPDSPEYGGILTKAGLDPKFFDLLKYAVELGHHFGIRIVFEWHESMIDRHRYFLGGNPADKNTGKPGTPLAWLAMSAEEYPEEDRPLFITMENPRHQKALFDSTAWLAAAFKGDAAVLGYEVPYNEPHERTVSNDENWRWLTFQTALRVKQADPGALTFGMPSGWGHENVFISSTWLLPEMVDGMTPHFYVGNGPIAVRDDASQRKYPYLARDVEGSLSLGLTALGLPYTACDYPTYNGEGGGHGAESFLPDLPLNEATRIMIEAQLVQAYATGMAGYFEWTMWNNEFWTETTVPNKSLFQRFAPLFQAGPVDYRKSPVLFVQNPGAETNANGHNFAAVSVARVILDLHLQPAHYMTDDQLIFTGQTMFSRGFEQVDSLSTGIGGYKAIIVDTRNVDKRALSIIRKSGVPVLEFGDDNPINVQACAEFLEEHQVPFDAKTSRQFQWVQGPEHLLVYRRSEGDASRVFPLLNVKGSFTLIDETGATAFSGNSEQLASQGLPVDLKKWTSAIYSIR